MKCIFKKFAIICKPLLAWGALAWFASSCTYFRSNRLFQTDKEIIGDSLLHKIKLAEKTYIVQKNDFISFQLFTNKGEVVVDPTGKVPSRYNNPANQANMQQNFQLIDRYLVYDDGYADLPMIGSTKLEGLSIHQLDSLLSAAYSKYYHEPYAVSRVVNKRVILTGAFGSRIIPLDNENMNLIEVLARTENMGTSTSSYAKFKNIRLIRGDLKNPNVYLIDLTTIEGMRKANLTIQPNDIIYVEPYRRVVLETIRDFSPLITLFTSFITLSVTLILLTTRR